MVIFTLFALAVKNIKSKVCRKSVMLYMGGRPVRISRGRGCPPPLSDGKLASFSFFTFINNKLAVASGFGLELCFSFLKVDISRTKLLRVCSKALKLIVLAVR